MVGLSICGILPTWIRLWIPSRRMALRAGRDYLGHRGSEPLVSGEKIKVAHSRGHGYSLGAGAILQKLWNYRIRLAVVCAPGSVRFSRMFGEMAAEESRSGYFQVFDSAQAAREWLSRT